MEGNKCGAHTFECTICKKDFLKFASIRAHVGRKHKGLCKSLEKKSLDYKRPYCNGISKKTKKGIKDESDVIKSSICNNPSTIEKKIEEDK
jgi:hypothetical protein